MVGSGQSVPGSRYPKVDVTGVGCHSVGGHPLPATRGIGMVTTVNAARAKQGKPRLGFLNPLLYSRPTILNDIAHGWNNCTAVPTK